MVQRAVSDMYRISKLSEGFRVHIYVKERKNVDIGEI